MNNHDFTLRELAARLGRAETENDRLRESNAELRVRAEFAEIAAAERLAEERKARIYAEAREEVTRQWVREARAETEEAGR